MPAALPGSAETATAFAAMAKAAAARDAAQRQAEATVAAARQRIVASLQEIGRQPLFREALIWQNRQALRDGVPLRGGGDGQQDTPAAQTWRPGATPAPV